jgi:hypothetical protein
MRVTEHPLLFGFVTAGGEPGVGGGTAELSANVMVQMYPSR